MTQLFLESIKNDAVDVDGLECQDTDEKILVPACKHKRKKIVEENNDDEDSTGPSSSKRWRYRDEVHDGQTTDGALTQPSTISTPLSLVTLDPEFDDSLKIYSR